MRGIVTPVPVLEQVLGPLIVGVPGVEPLRTRRAPATSARCAGTSTTCSTPSRSRSPASTPTELDAGMTVLVRDYAERRAPLRAHRRRRDVPRPHPGQHRRLDRHPGARRAGRGRLVQDVQHAARARPSVARITTWEQAATSYTPVATPGLTCTSSARVRAVPRDVLPGGLAARGARRRASASRRQTPDFRQLVTLSQAALDPADPINYARFYMLRSLPALDGTPQAPRPLLVATTAGDDEVTTAAGLAFARAAGALPFLPPSGRDDDARVRRLRDARRRSGTPGAASRRTRCSSITGEMEGVSRLGRTPGIACGNDYAPSSRRATRPRTPAPAVVQRHALRRGLAGRVARRLRPAARAAAAAPRAAWRAHARSIRRRSAPGVGAAHPGRAVRQRRRVDAERSRSSRR